MEARVLCPFHVLFGHKYVCGFIGFQIRPIYGSRSLGHYF
jgi:hypothetical protein